MMTDEAVRVILARADAATPGPWKVVQNVFDTEPYLVIPDGRSIPQSDEDAEFCAAARDDVPALCQELLRTREVLRTLLAGGKERKQT